MSFTNVTHTATNNNYSLKQGVDLSVINLIPLKNTFAVCASIVSFNMVQGPFESSCQGEIAAAIAAELYLFSEQFCNITVKMLLGCYEQL